ncbi:MAG: polyphosphate kinase 1 [Desulforhopalus sp.]
MKTDKPINIDSFDAYINRELSWLAFARRVLELTRDPELPLLERVKFVGIMGMIFDEFVMKRLGGLKSKIEKDASHISSDGHTPQQELALCWPEMQRQTGILDDLIEKDIRPALQQAGIPIRNYESLSEDDIVFLRKYFNDFVFPILTPLAVDIGHPFPFISNLGFNIAIVMTEPSGRTRFVRIKVPANRPRWIPLPGNRGFVPLEQVIAQNLASLFPLAASFQTSFFRVTRAAKDNPWERTRREDELAIHEPGSLIGMVTQELTLRKFAGIVRLEISRNMPPELRSWLMEQLDISADVIIPLESFLGCADLLDLKVDGKDELRDPPHIPTHHPRLHKIRENDYEGFFREIKKKDILIHLPYHSFDSSVLRLLQHAASDPNVLAIKLTIYRTSAGSPIIQALMDAVARGKQVAVLVEITARFDEAPNIAWGKMLERAGAHVVYGMERLKTHVKLAMVVREESEGIKRYLHVGTGNYHTGTAKLYEDLGILSCNDELGENVSRLFNELTGATPPLDYNLLLVAPHNMRERFTALIQQEAINKKEGKPSGIRAKLNQLQDRQLIRELYLASQAGVPITLNIRGLCSLRAGVKGLSDTIRVFSILGRFLEHSRIYRFENSGNPLFFIGSADWMQRNLNKRMESIMPVLDATIKEELEHILTIYESDNTNAWEMQPDGNYLRRKAEEGKGSIVAQDIFASLTGTATSYKANEQD